jgi:hypothetical protein
MAYLASVRTEGNSRFSRSAIWDKNPKPGLKSQLHTNPMEINDNTNGMKITARKKVPPLKVSLCRTNAISRAIDISLGTTSTA